MAGFRRDRRRERYSRNLEGLNAQGFYSPSASPAYTTDATLNEFLRNAPEGEVGVYDSAGALVTAAITNQAVKIVQKQDGNVRTSTEIAGGSFVARKTNYLAPQAQVTVIGYDPAAAAGSLNINIVGGLQEFVASARETTPGNQPFPVTEGRSVVRSGTPSEYDICNDIASDIGQNIDYEDNADENFVTVEILNDATGDAVTGATTWQVLKGSNQVFVAGTDVTADAAPGDFLYFRPAAGSTAPYAVYRVVSSTFAGGNTTIILDRNWARDTGSLPDTDVLSDDAADGLAAACGIRFRGRDELVSFEVSVSEDLGDADNVVTTPWLQGSGAAFQVASMEDETSVFAGFTVNNMPWTQDFGQPSLFVDDTSADEYVLYFIEYNKSIQPSAGTPQNQTLHQGYIIVAAINGSDLETNLDTILAPTIN